MKIKLPRISVIIPVEPEGSCQEAIEALKKVFYPSKLFEVILVRGYSPSKQRNEAAKRARGKIIYFLDSDSQIHPNNFRKIVAGFHEQAINGIPLGVRGFSILPSFINQWIENKFFNGKKTKNPIAVVGGPAIWLKPESFWPSVGGIVFESFFADLNMCSRFRPVGRMRRTDEKELVLCNLAVKRSIFEKLGGLREDLYPNEENEFLNRQARKGYDCLYLPSLYVFKPRRKSFYAILKTFFNYGRGRMENMRIVGATINSPALPPLLLLFYLLSLFFIRVWWFLIPILVYFGLGFASALGFAIRMKKPYLAFFLPPFILLVHLSYAIGLLYGLVTDLKKKKRISAHKKVEIVFLKKFNGKWVDSV